MNSSAEYNDFYRYDAVSDTWDSLPDFPGSTRNYAIGIAINGKGYVGFGSTGGLPLRDLWEYNPATSTWTKKANCPCDARFHPAFAMLNGKLYVGLGDG